MTREPHDPEALLARLDRIAAALERFGAPAPARADFTAADAFVWQPAGERFEPVARVNRVPLGLLKGIDHVADLLLANTERFARGLPANNALLWGARGMGKSSLVKAVHGEIVGRSERSARQRAEAKSDMSRPGLSDFAAGAARPALPPTYDPILIEIHREDIGSLPRCLAHLRPSRHRFIVFCDDLSFDKDDTSYKSLKAVLEGGIEGRPANVIFYATSNRRHLMPREMVENERSTAINPAEAVEEKVSLSDRFGLWLGFHNCSQDDFLGMVRAYREHFGLTIDDGRLVHEALEWSLTRGARSGRVAWQFIQDLAGKLGTRLEP